MLSESLISRILLYSLHIAPMSTTNIYRNYKDFYAKYIRIATEGKYTENWKRINNEQIRNDSNVTTIESKLKYYRPNMYYRIREAHSLSYLNDKEYINDELKSMGTYINSLGEN